MSESVYTAADLVAHAGISRRQLDYWCRQNVLVPAVAANGSGTNRLFDEREVRVAAVLRNLRDHGCPLAVLRDVAGRLRECPELWEQDRLFVNRFGEIEDDPTEHGWVVALQQRCTA